MKDDHVSDVIHHNDTVRATIIAACNGAETLLTGRVPDLQFDCFAVQIDCPDLKVNPNGGDVAFSVGVVLKNATNEVDTLKHRKSKQKA